MGSGGIHAHRQVPQGRRAHGHNPGERAGMSPLPRQPLAQALEHQPAGAGERGDQKAHPRRRHLPQRPCGHLPGGAVLLEQHEHWQLEGRRMLSLDSMAAIPASAEALPEADQERVAVP
jgi:hypothetical protein